MCSSSPRRCRRAGLSLLESLVALVIFGLALAPVIWLFGSARRASASADRMLRATLYGQTVLDALVALKDDELPPVPDAETELAGTAGSGRWDEIVAMLALPPPFPMERRVTGRRLLDGSIELKVALAWERLPGRPETRHGLTLRGLRVPRPVP